MDTMQRSFLEHVPLDGGSTVEIETDAGTRTTYREAHSRVGDPDYQKFIPERCWTCHTQNESKKEALGVPATKVDEEWEFNG